MQSSGAGQPTFQGLYADDSVSESGSVLALQHPLHNYMDNKNKDQNRDGHTANTFLYCFSEIGLNRVGSILIG